MRSTSWFPIGDTASFQPGTPFAKACCERWISMHGRKRYQQLKLEIYNLKDQFHNVPLSFRIGKRSVSGILDGSAADWVFRSASPGFLKLVPSGSLGKYHLWIDSIPGEISNVYNEILEAALKSGYDLVERELLTGESIIE